MTPIIPSDLEHVTDTEARASYVAATKRRLLATMQQQPTDRTRGLTHDGHQFELTLDTFMAVTRER